MRGQDEAKQISLFCDLIPARSRCSYLGSVITHAPLFTVHPYNYNKSFIGQACSAKMWDIGIVIFLMDLAFCSVHTHAKKRTLSISRRLDLTLVQKPIFHKPGIQTISIFHSQLGAVRVHEINYDEIEFKNLLALLYSF